MDVEGVFEVWDDVASERESSYDCEDIIVKFCDSNEEVDDEISPVPSNSAAHRSSGGRHARVVYNWQEVHAGKTCLCIYTVYK